ncbi:hypothetical protein HMPREF3127_02310 [Sphingobacterium sp. HMSC13C05]|uniref:helix-turn-helix domain-containing protein n=1 Tax=Sphingobacterium sp. HMSC13C05 TaxID=1581095 RepID=UPI0008A5AEC6|nr:helix-turn-helix domain-containing protein [Sphingobacterium sp. HMSC13C05]OFV20936.1 hypothetical protein HMPREF3127_02310 [Sphingobacterium sp. HMSC13C05]
MGKAYETVGNAGVACLRCGIARPTLRKWVKRFKESGIDGLSELSRRSHKIHHRITKEDEQRILELRTNRNLGHRRIVSEMKRLYGVSISTATVHKILKRIINSI